MSSTQKKTSAAEGEQQSPSQGEFTPGTPMSPQEAHVRGECRPCAYFRHKADGCRQGDDCPFCHLCDHDAIKRLKKAKRQRMRVQDRQRKGSVSSQTTAETNSPTRTVDEEVSPSSFKAIDGGKRASFGIMTDVPPLPSDEEPGDASPFKKGEPARIELAQIRSPPGLSRPYLPPGLHMTPPPHQTPAGVEEGPPVAAPKVLRTPVATEKGPGLGVMIEPLPKKVSGLSPFHQDDEQPSPSQRVSVRLQNMFPELQLKRPTPASPFTVSEMFPELRSAMDAVPQKKGDFGDVVSQPHLMPAATPAGTSRSPGSAYNFVGLPSYFPGGSRFGSIGAGAERGPWPKA